MEIPVRSPDKILHWNLDKQYGNYLDNAHTIFQQKTLKTVRGHKCAAYRRSEHYCIGYLRSNNDKSATVPSSLFAYQRIRNNSYFLRTFYVHAVRAVIL